MITNALNAVGFIISLYLMVGYDIYLHPSQSGTEIRRKWRMYTADALKIRFQVLVILGLVACGILALAVWMMF
jgi:hypothetical protein